MKIKIEKKKEKIELGDIVEVYNMKGMIIEVHKSYYILDINTGDAITNGYNSIEDLLNITKAILIGKNKEAEIIIRR